jgi:Zn-dependent membrane protease YugP
MCPYCNISFTCAHIVISYLHVPILFALFTESPIKFNATRTASNVLSRTRQARGGESSNAADSASAAPTES